MTEPVRTPPFAPFEWLLAGRYLRARRKEGFISVIAGFSFLGIMLGVATLIIVMAVMNGFRNELLDKILGLNGHLLVQPLDSPLTDWKDVAERINGVDGHPARRAGGRGPGAGVVAVQRRRACSCAASAPTTSATSPRSPTTSSRARWKASTRARASRSAAGSPISSSLHAGDSVTLVSPRGAVTPMGTTPRIKPYKVAAVFEIGMSEYDFDLRVHAAGRGAGLFQPRRPTSPRSRSTPTNPDAHRQLPQAGHRGGRRAPVFLVDWRQRNSTFFTALQVERNVMFLILTLIVLVAALNIISGLIMLVKDKGSDIAILRTMGASQGAIMRDLPDHRRRDRRGRHAGRLRRRRCWSASTSRRSGSSSPGSPAPNCSRRNCISCRKLPAEIDVGETSAVVMMALALSFLATLYPSWRAARLDPVEALRYE